MNTLQKILFPPESNLPIEDIQNLLQKWTVKKKLKRFEYLLREGQVGAHLYFVRKGALRIFYVSDNTEVCVGFSYENNTIIAYPSFISKQASVYNIQALTNTELIGISRTDFYNCIHNSWALERYWRKLTEQALLGRLEREMDLITTAPQKRLERLLNRSPHLFQWIPHKYIASYLRMTPETLSRMLHKVKS